MDNKFKDIDIKIAHTNFLWYDQNKKNIDPNKIKVDSKLYKNIVIYYVGYVMVIDLRYIKISSVNPLYLITDKTNENIKERNGNKRLVLVPTD